MQLILREDVKHLGKSGDVVKVKPGFGRNYLLPRGLAVLASEHNMAKLNHDKAVIAHREAKLMRTSDALMQRLAEASVNITKQVGEEDKLYGSVTTRDIAAALAEQGIEIDRKKITIPEPIKSLGVHTVTVSLGRGFTSELKVWVVAK